MSFSRLLVVAFVSLASGLPGAAVSAKENGKKTGRILMVTESAGFKHDSVNRKDDPAKLSPAEEAVTKLGIASGVFRVDCTQDVAKDFTKEALDNHDIVFFYTTGELPIDKKVKDYFLTDWVKQPGHGFIGTHSAADTFDPEDPKTKKHHDYEPYWEMIGGTFDGHPWEYTQNVTVTVHDQEHPVSKPWGPEFKITDEIYKFRHWQPEKVRVLMSLNMEKTEHKEAYHVPIAWVKQYGEGRVLYMSLGHREDVWTNPVYMASLLGGVNWILGNEKGSATPNPEVSAAEEAKAKAAAEKAKAAAKSAANPLRFSLRHKVSGENVLYLEDRPIDREQLQALVSEIVPESTKVSLAADQEIAASEVTGTIDLLGSFGLHKIALTKLEAKAAAKK